MKTLLAAATAALALAACATVDGPAAGNPRDVKIAFDITESDPQKLLAKLGIIETTRKQVLDAGGTPHLVLAFRADASYFTQSDLSKVKESARADALKVAAKLRELRAAPGVEAVEQCNLPLAPRKLSKEALVSGVKLVPNGWISLAEYQRKGYSYIAP